MCYRSPPGIFSNRPQLVSATRHEPGRSCPGVLSGVRLPTRLARSSREWTERVDPESGPRAPVRMRKPPASASRRQTAWPHPSPICLPACDVENPSTKLRKPLPAPNPAEPKFCWRILPVRTEACILVLSNSTVRTLFFRSELDPGCLPRALNKSGAVAQLVRVPDCRSGGCGFESRRPRWRKPVKSGENTSPLFLCPYHSNAMHSLHLGFSSPSLTTRSRASRPTLLPAFNPWQISAEKLVRRALRGQLVPSIFCAGSVQNNCMGGWH